MGSELLPSACYIFSDDSTTFYSTSNGYKNRETINTNVDKNTLERTPNFLSKCKPSYNCTTHQCQSVNSKRYIQQFSPLIHCTATQRGIILSTIPNCKIFSEVSKDPFHINVIVIKAAWNEKKQRIG